MITKENEIPRRSLREAIVLWSISLGGIAGLSIFSPHFREWVGNCPVFCGIVAGIIVLMLIDEVWYFITSSKEEKRNER